MEEKEEVEEGGGGGGGWQGGGGRARAEEEGRGREAVGQETAETVMRSSCRRKSHPHEVDLRGRVLPWQAGHVRGGETLGISL